jgi:Fic family protein
MSCGESLAPSADVTLAAVLRKARVWQHTSRYPINSRQRVVINRMLNGFEGPLSTSKYATLAKCSTDTAPRDIQELVEHGVLVRNASGGRSTSYRISDALADLDRK